MMTITMKTKTTEAYLVSNESHARMSAVIKNDSVFLWMGDEKAREYTLEQIFFKKDLLETIEFLKKIVDILEGSSEEKVFLQEGKRYIRRDGSITPSLKKDHKEPRFLYDWYTGMVYDPTDKNDGWRVYTGINHEHDLMSEYKKD